MFKGIDFYSDTVTKPTGPMLRAMVEAEVGDEQMGEDPTTLALEKKTAELLGLSAALFLPSSTMANQIALQLHCARGEELLAAENCHLFFAEAGGPAIHAGVMVRPIPTPTGIFTADQVRKTFRHKIGPHYPVSKLLSIENTTNMGGGLAWSKEELDSVLDVANELGLKTHLDGSRLFNAVVKMELSPKEIASRFDTVTVCLSKGLGCAMGALLGFDKKHYVTVRRLKQLMGGSLRQSGILAAAGLYAFENHIHRIKEDHANATFFAQELESIKHLSVEKNPHGTNMVFFHWVSSGISDRDFLRLCIEQGVRFSHVDHNRFRAVTHLNLSRSDIEKAMKTVRGICNEI